MNLFLCFMIVLWLIFIGTLVLFIVLIRKYKEYTTRRADIKVPTRVSKKERVPKKNGTLCYKTPLPIQKAFKKDSRYNYNEIYINLPLSVY